MSAAYIAVLTSLIMMCGELWTRGRLVARQVGVGSNMSTLVLVMACAMSMLWAASFICTIWGWSVTSKSFQNHHSLEECYSVLDIKIDVANLPSLLYCVLGK